MKLIAFLFLIFNSPAWADSKNEDQITEGETRVIMSGLYSGLKDIFPLSFQEKEFADPKNSKIILDGLIQLKNKASALHKHIAKQPVSAFVADALRNDADTAQNMYTTGHYKEAAFIVHHMIENCIGCHSSNAATQHFVNGQELSKVIKSQNLSPNERVKLLITTRQFDDALLEIEKYLSNPGTDLSQAFSNGMTTDYLKIAIQVREKPEQAEKLMANLAQNTKLPTFVAKTITHWKADLQTINSQNTKKLGLSEIRETLAQLNQDSFLNSASYGYVKYFYIASRLQKLLQDHPNKVEQSEIYYLLGYVENLVEHSFWLSETKFYLQAAINVLPHSPSAEKAYVLLEELTTAGFSGSAGLDMPQDVAQWLAKLKIKAMVGNSSTKVKS